MYNNYIKIYYNYLYIYSAYIIYTQPLAEITTRGLLSILMPWSAQCLKIFLEMIIHSARESCCSRFFSKDYENPSARGSTISIMFSKKKNPDSKTLYHQRDKIRFHTPSPQLLIFSHLSSCSCHPSTGRRGYKSRLSSAIYGDFKVSWLTMLEVRTENIARK